MSERAGAPARPGAGRIASLRMRPLTLFERGVAQPVMSMRHLLEGLRPEPDEEPTNFALADYVEEILASGFSGIRSLPPRARRSQLDGYLRRIVERDHHEWGSVVRRPETLRAWLRAYAAATSTTASWEKLRDAATSGHDDKPAKATTISYRDDLTRAWLLDEIPAWTPTRNHVARLAMPPKHQLADPALAARLLNVDATSLLGDLDVGGPARDGRLLGQLFESLVTLDVLVHAQANEAHVSHLRTKGGDREVDLIVEGTGGRVLAIEVKLVATPTDDDVRHLHWLSRTIGDDLVDMVVVTTGRFAYRRVDGVLVVPAAPLGP